MRGWSNCRKVSLPPGCRKFVFHHVSRPDHHVVTVGPVGRLGPRLCRWIVHPARFSRVFPSRRPFAACLHLTPFPAVACFPAPVGLRLAVLGTCWSFLRSVSAFGGPLPRRIAFSVRREDSVHFDEQKSTRMYTKNDKKIRARCTRALASASYRIKIIYRMFLYVVVYYIFYYFFIIYCKFDPFSFYGKI